MGKFARSGAFVIAAAAASSIVFVPSAMAAGPGADDPAKAPAVGDTYRVQGSDRVKTSIKAAELQGSKAATKVILVEYNNFADAIATTPLADCTDAPVLITKGGTLSPDVATYLKANAVSDVTILGDATSITYGTQKQVEKLTGNQALRVGAADRYGTAQMLAALSTECFDGTDTNLRTALLNQQAVEAAKRAVGETKAEFDAAAAALDAADKKVIDLQKKLAAEQAQLDNLSKQLKPSAPPVGYDSWTEYINEAAFAQSDAVAAYNRSVGQRAVFTDLLGTDSATTLNTDSTLDQYIAAFPARAQAIRDAAAYFGIATSSTLNAAIDAANAQVNSDGTAVNATGTVLAQRLVELMDAAAADAANKPVLDQMAKIAAQMRTDRAALKQAMIDQGLANDRYVAARDAYLLALANQPSAQQIYDAQQATAAALKVTIQEAGDYPVFLASGSDFPDALSAGAASQAPANVKKGVVLLTKGAMWDTRGFTKPAYLDVAKPQVVSIGGLATAAIGRDKTDANVVVGNDRYETAALVARKYFTASSPVALASGEVFADAMVGSSFIANSGDGALLLTRNNTLSPATQSYFVDRSAINVAVMGSPAGISDSVRNQVEAILK